MANADTPEVVTLMKRARRLARRGEHRKAALALREASALAPSAVAYCRLGAALERAGRPHEAVMAFKEALYILRLEHDRPRERTVATIILALDPEDRAALRAA